MTAALRSVQQEGETGRRHISHATVHGSADLSLAFSVATLVWDHKLIPNQGG